MSELIETPRARDPEPSPRAAGTGGGVVRQEYRVAMRDGVELQTVVFRPGGGAALPALISRTPYGTESVISPIEPVGTAGAAAGYVIVVQDVRGRFRSGGEHDMAVSERDDAWDTIDWIVGQPWCNGRVGIVGASALGMTAWLACGAGHPAVGAMSVGVTGRVFDGFGYYTRGIVQPDVLYGWSANQILPDALDRSGADVGEPNLRELTKSDSTDLLLEMARLGPGQAERMAELGARAGDALKIKQRALAAIAARPAGAVEALGKHLPWVADWAKHPDPEDAFWLGVDYGDVLENVRIPVLHMAGWHDLFVRGTLRNFASAASSGSAVQRIVVTPFTHLAGTPVGEWMPPLAAVPDSLGRPGAVTYAPERELLRRWFDRWLKDADNGADRAAPVTFYVQRANVWREEQQWPLAGTRWTRLHLRSRSGANSRHGDGLLTEQAPTETGADRYRFDPTDPVPSAGGTFLGISHPAGIFDQQPVEDRDDVLVYTGGRTVDGIEVTGPISVELFVSTSAVDTDFTAKLADVDADGRSTNVCEGATRLRFRAESPGLVQPGSVQRVVIELSPTSYLFRPGHAIRLQVSSSSFPLMQPNSNTGHNEAVEPVRPVTAHQVVYHDADRPSALLLPVIPHDRPRR